MIWEPGLHRLHDEALWFVVRISSFAVGAIPVCEIRFTKGASRFRGGEHDADGCLSIAVLEIGV